MTCNFSPNPMCGDFQSNTACPLEHCNGQDTTCVTTTATDILDCEVIAARGGYAQVEYNAVTSECRQIKPACSSTGTSSGWSHCEFTSWSPPPSSQPLPPPPPPSDVKVLNQFVSDGSLGTQHAPALGDVLAFGSDLSGFVVAAAQLGGKDVNDGAAAGRRLLEEQKVITCADGNNGGCFELSVCVNTALGRTCGECPPGYVGDGVTCVDVDECAVDNGGCDPLTRCANQPGGATCGPCPTNFKGDGTTGCRRETVCAINNGGCDPRANCTDLGRTKSSCGPCPPGYTGDGSTGCVDADGCALEPCAPGVYCEDIPAPGTGRRCGACPPGRAGDGVTCAVDPCFVNNGGCDALRSCATDPLAAGGRVCGACPAGYAAAGSAGCVEVDACAASPCFAGVECVDLPPPSEARRCGPCPPGFDGDGVACVDVDECAAENGGCDPRTECVNTPGSRACGACPDGLLGNGYSGCKEPSPCATNNGGCDAATTCEDNVGAAGVTCGACPAGYDGTGATGCVDIDGCVDSPCFPGVVCADTPAPGLPAPGRACGACPEGMRGNGTHCEQCGITARLLATTVVDGRTKRSADLRVVAGLSPMAADCTNELGYSFAWSAMTSAGEQLALDAEINKADTPQLYVPKGSLLFPGLSYTLRFDARKIGNAKVADSLAFTLLVASLPLEPVVTGGNARLAEGQPFTLDASSSRDPDDNTAHVATYEWTCAAFDAGAQGACDKDAEGEPFTPPKSGATIGPLRLAGSAAGIEYRWTMTVRKGPRSASTTTTVTVVRPPPGAGPPPVVSIAPLPSDGAVNAGDVARLMGTVVAGGGGGGGGGGGAALDLTWSATRVADGGNLSEAVDLTAPGVLRSTGGVKQPNLVLAPNALAAGYAYTFTLAARNVATGATGAAFLRAATNEPPDGGGVAVVPVGIPVGAVALQTSFKMFAAGWTDAHPPLLYRFVAHPVGSAAPPVQLRDFSPLASHEAVLPGGLDSHAGAVTVSVQVKDALGAVSAPVGVNVTVTWPTFADAAAATAAMTALVDGAERLLNVDPEGAMALVSGTCALLARFEAAEGRKRRFQRRLSQVLTPDGGGDAATTSATAANATNATNATNAATSPAAAAAATPPPPPPPAPLMQLPEDDCGVPDATTSADAAKRSAQRSRMLGVVGSAQRKVTPSSTLLAAAAAGAAAVMGSPCETDGAARAAGIDLVGALMTSAGGDVELSDDAAAGALAALSGAISRGGLAASVEPAAAPALAPAPAAEAGGGGGDSVAREANARERNATGLARSAMALALARAVAGETPRVMTSSRIILSAQRVAPENNTDVDAGAGAGARGGDALGTAFVVPPGALFAAAASSSAGAGASADRMQATYMYDAHAADEDDAARAAAEEDEYARRAGLPPPVRSAYRGAEKASATVSLSFSVSSAGADGAATTAPLRLRDLPVPITFAVPLLSTAATARPACPVVNASNASAVMDEKLRLRSLSPNRTGEVQPACTFWDEEKMEQSDEGCGTLPPVFPPGGASFGWDPAVLNGTFNFSGSRGRPLDRPKALRWARTFAHPTLLAGCELIEATAADNVTRVVSWNGTGCAMQDPGNAFKCFWRLETQQFEGCGCVAATAVQCACTHLTDFAASAAPPKVNVISIDDLVSISPADILNSITVLIFVFAMFLATAILCVAFSIRDSRALRAIRKRFFEGDRASRDLRFAKVKGVWTWSCEMPDAQSTFLALYMSEKELEGAGVEASSLPKDSLSATLGESRFWAEKYGAMRDILAEKGFAGEKIDLDSSVFVSFMEKLICDDVRAAEPELMAVVDGGEDPETRAGLAWENATDEVRKKITVLRVLRGDLTPETETTPAPPTTLGRKLPSSIRKPTLMRGMPKTADYVQPWTAEEDNAVPGDDKEFDGMVTRRVATTRERERREIARRQTGVASDGPGEETPAAASADAADEEVAKIIAATAAASNGAQCMRSDEGLRLDVSDAPASGRILCDMVMLNYVRFNVSFPMEQLRRSLVITQRVRDDDENAEDADDARKRSLAGVEMPRRGGGAVEKRGSLLGGKTSVDVNRDDDNDDDAAGGKYLPFNRAIGTALVYAFFDVRNVVDHREMSKRIYAASLLPWLLPEGYTFVYLVAKFKRMMVGTLTTSMWLQRSSMWSLLSLQAEDGGWYPDDAIAGALRAGGDPVLAPNPNSSGASRAPNVMKSYFSADVLLRCMPRGLQACAGKHGWSKIDRVWVTLLALKLYDELGHKWVINPWDDDYAEYDLKMKAWSFLDMAAKDHPDLAATILDSEAEAAAHVTRWRVNFTEKVERFKLEQDGIAALKAAENTCARRIARFLNAVPTYTVSDAVAGITASTKKGFADSVKTTRWLVLQYMKAHMFWRCFTASPMDAFTAAERITMQATIYFMALVTTIWFFYERAEACCLQLRSDVGCSGDILEDCKGIQGGCSQLMSEQWLKPEDWQCGAFPDTKNNPFHLVWLIVINVMIMFPVKFVLVRVFTAGGAVLLEPHWRAALVHAGLSYIEVYVAWMEVAYQVLTDPASALGSPQFLQILVLCKSALTNTGMVCCVSYGGYLFYTLPRKIVACIVGPAEPKSMLYGPQSSVLRRLQVVAAADAPEGVHKDYATPLFTALEAARTGGLGGGGGGGGGRLPSAIQDDLRDARDARNATEKLASKLTELRRQLRRSAGQTKRVGETLVARLDVIGLAAWHRKFARSAFFWGYIVKNSGWCLAGFAWAMGTWVVLAYGVLIYTYLGPGEEEAFLRAWGITFVVNNFGLESMAVISRKAFFIWVVEKLNKFLKYRTVVEWYENVIEVSGRPADADGLDFDAHEADEDGDDDDGGDS